MSSARRHPRVELDTVSSSAAQPGDPDTRRRIVEAALRLITKEGGAAVSLAAVAKAAGVSRQALYLHFADRAALFLAVVRHADERRGLTAAVAELNAAPTGVASMRGMVAMQARMNPGLWPLAHLLDAVRRDDPAAEQSWQDRLAHRLQGCRAIVERLRDDGALRADIDRDVAADLLWVLTSFRTWEDLVRTRGWTADAYQARMVAALERLLLDTPDAASPTPARRRQSTATRRSRSAGDV